MLGVGELAVAACIAQVNDDSEFFGLLREFAAAKQEYDKLKGAISQVENGGYGIVNNFKLNKNGLYDHTKPAQ